MLEEVEQAVAAASPQALQHAAHTLKGSVGNFAASSAVAASFALEKMGRQQDLMNAPAALIKLKSEIERLIPVLAMVKEKEAA
jgi:HPt (histidine-containing phosphotransfer) domain-containing protein